MMRSDFESHLDKATNKATFELREIVKQNHKKDKTDPNIYPYEATFTALVFHHLLNRCLEVENLHVEAPYEDGKKRMDLFYSNPENNEEYCIEVKTVLGLTKKLELLKVRDGLTGIIKDIKKLNGLKGRKKRFMIVAYLGLEDVNDKVPGKWKNQISKYAVSKGLDIRFVEKIVKIVIPPKQF